MNEINRTKSPRLQFTTWIGFGILAGLACGLFFGEYVEPLHWVSDAFVGLLQMSVLPYVTISLIANIGSLTLGTGFRLVRTGVLIMLLLWVIGLLSLVIMAQSFPKWDTGSFFSSRFTEEPPSADWLNLFVPANPFRALSENLIPAVVVFSIGLGVALMHHPDKQKLLGPLDVLVDSLATLNKLIVKLTPIGMFAIVAHTAGTIAPGQFGLLQGYLLTYGFASLAMSLVILPLLIASVTPLRYTEVLKACRDPMVASFVIGSTFVVLPMIIEAVKTLERQTEPEGDVKAQPPEYLVPLGYPFPDIGRLLGLVFIPFAAWFFGRVIEAENYAPLLGVGFLGSFGKPVITIPLMLRIAELPGDIFNLYLASGVIAARFGDLMKAMHLIAFSILTICVLNGTARFQLRKSLLRLASSLLVLALGAVSIRTYLTASFQDRYSRENLVTERAMIFPEYDRASDIIPRMQTVSAPNPMPIRDGESRIDRIKRYGRIRVGYEPNRQPFSYFHADGNQLIGFDIQMAYQLAADLKVGIEFVPFQIDRLPQQLGDDHFDVAMSALEGNITQAASLPADCSYMHVTLAIVVPDKDRRKFRSLESMSQLPYLRLAGLKGDYFVEEALRVLPTNVGLTVFDSAADYFEGGHEDVDGLVVSAESGSAWTLEYPEFDVVNPFRGRIRVPLHYLTAEDREFEAFLCNWIELKKSNGTFQDFYDHWILGLEKRRKEPRWSVLRDVLGWVN